MPESRFGGLTNQIETYSMIELTNAGSMALARQNGDFNIDRTHASNETKDTKFTLNFNYTYKNMDVIPLKN